MSDERCEYLPLYIPNPWMNYPDFAVGISNNNEFHYIKIHNFNNHVVQMNKKYYSIYLNRIVCY